MVIDESRGLQSSCAIIKMKLVHNQLYLLFCFQCDRAASFVRGGAQI